MRTTMPLQEQATEDREANQEFTDNKFSDTASKAKEPDPFMDWLELETKKGDPINFDQIPAFNVRFAELIRKTTRRSYVAFTDLLQTDAFIFSYVKFVERLGGDPTHIFNIFGMNLIKKHKVDFLNSWMLAQYLRIYPMINKTEGVDLEFFDLNLFQIDE